MEKTNITELKKIILKEKQGKNKILSKSIRLINNMLSTWFTYQVKEH